MRTLTPAPFREQIALMMERLGHTIITDPTMIGQPQMLKCFQVGVFFAVYRKILVFSLSEEALR